MENLGWFRTFASAAVGLVVATTGCGSSKGQTSSEPTQVGGATGSGGGVTSPGGASAGGAVAGGAVAGGAVAGASAMVGGSTGMAGNSGASGGTGSAGRNTSSRGGSSGSPAACSTHADCENGTVSEQLCSVPTHECVECLTPSDCMAGGAGTAGAAGAHNATNLACVKNTCVTYTPCVNSLGCPSGMVCDTVLGRCAECTKDADCPTDSRCRQNLCRTSCVSDKNCTPLGLLCNSGAGHCVSCNSTADCAADRFCSGGECLRDVCVANSTRCQNNGIATCFTDGSGWGTPVTCASGRACVSNANGGAVCQPWACTPSTMACSATEDKVISCSADGMTPTTVDDCASKSKVCVSGTCAAVVCTPNQRFCQSNALRTCTAKGDSSTLYATCSSTQFCDSTLSSCLSMVCNPNQPACNGSVATTCDSIGSGFLTGGIDCAAGSSGQVCSAGTCQSLLCAPNTYFCDNSSAPVAVRLCSSTGLTSSISSTCSPGYYCDGSTARPACRAQVCTPAAAVCNGNLATTCNSMGSGYLAGGTDCSTTTNQVCSAGTCQALVCTPNSYSCNAATWPNTIQYCAPTGLTSSVYSTCSSTQYCDGTTTIPTCKPQLCTPNQPTCNGNVATTCNANGSGFVAGGTDCTGTALPICGLGRCGNSVVDSIDNFPASGSAVSTLTTQSAVNFYTATSSHTLTQIELYLDLGATTALTWIVYASIYQVGTYGQIWAGNTIAPAGAGYQSSGAISVPLVAGTYYAIATSWGTPSTSLTCYFRNATAPIAVSFGSLTYGSTSATMPITYSSFVAYPQRLTTTP